LFEVSWNNRNDAIYTKDQLLVDDDGNPRRQPWELWFDATDEHLSEWMRATSPNGAAAYEGRVQWSGDLGRGVQAPPPPQSELDGHETAQ
jgi:NADH-quinone oxidoreductase subunit I